MTLGTLVVGIIVVALVGGFAQWLDGQFERNTILADYLRTQYYHLVASKLSREYRKFKVRRDRVLGGKYTKEQWDALFAESEAFLDRSIELSEKGQALADRAIERMEKRNGRH